MGSFFYILLSQQQEKKELHLYNYHLHKGESHFLYI